jgi:hypothetical protein
MRHYTILLAAAALLTLSVTACRDDKPDIKTEEIYKYYPEVCDQFIALPAYDRVEEKVFGNGEKKEVHFLEREDHEEGVPATDFAIWIMTGGGYLKEVKETALARYQMSFSKLESMYNKQRTDDQLAPGIPQVEQILKEEGIFPSDLSRVLTRAVTTVYGYSYRVTGLRDLRIITKTPLYGQPEGADVTRFFSIVNVSPDQIFSSKTMQMEWDGRSREHPTDISEWIAIEPLAPITLALRTTMVPSEELPVDASLEVILTTVEGKELRDSFEVHLK